jgi:hypothetical protein
MIKGAATAIVEMFSKFNELLEFQTPRFTCLRLVPMMEKGKAQSGAPQTGA